MRLLEDHEHDVHDIRRAEDDHSCRPARVKRKGILEPHRDALSPAVGPDSYSLASARPTVLSDPLGLFSLLPRSAKDLLERMADDDKFAQRVLREVALLLSDRECAADTLTFYIEGWNRDPGWDWWGYLKSKYKLPYRDNPFRRRPRGPFLRGPSGWPGYSEPDKSPYPWTKKKTEVESHEQRRQRLLARLKGIDEEEKRVRDQLQMLVELFALAEITDAISPGGQARRARDILRRLIDRARSEAEEGVAGDPKLRAVLDAVDAADRDLQRLDEERASIRRELGNAAK